MMPTDFSISTPFNDPAVISRFHTLLDQVIPYLNSSVKYISLGNEVDTYPFASSAEWLQYRELIEDARDYIHQFKPDIKVGVTTTFDGFAGNASAQTASDVASLNANMDVIILTYYPTSTNFMARDPSEVSTDTAKMVSIAAGKPLVMQEWGYPSSNVLSGSEQKQADFITNTFIAWRQYGSNRIPFISFFKRRDWSTGDCATMTGQTSGQSFYEFMCSLGLISNDGLTEKPAYTVLTTELSNL
jgi:exo-beta-1,3-glucanase (GH17 family)